MASDSESEMQAFVHLLRHSNVKITVSHTYTSSHTSTDTHTDDDDSIEEVEVVVVQEEEESARIYANIIASFETYDNAPKTFVKSSTVLNATSNYYFIFLQ